MDDRDILTVLMFGLGIVLQAANLIKGKPAFSKILVCLIVPLIPFLPGKNEGGETSLAFQLLVSLFYFVIIFAGIFKDDILPVINERVLLIFTIFFWYSHMSLLGSSGLLSDPVVWIGVPFTVFVLFHAFTFHNIGFKAKVALYVWFLISVTSVSYLYLSASFLRNFLIDGHLYQVSSLDAFLTGSSFLYLAANILYLYQLIPIPSKRQSIQSRMKQWREDIQLMGKKYDNYQLQVWQSAGILVFLGSLFTLNSVYQFLAPQLLLSLALVVLSLSERVGVFVGKGSSGELNSVK